MTMIRAHKVGLPMCTSTPRVKVGKRLPNCGRSESVSGNKIVVGAHQNDDNGSASGSAYVFKYDAETNSWPQVTKLTASDGAANDYCGSSVSVSGDVIVVGIYGDDDNGPSSGSGYVYRFA